jgi:acyl carrier protein
VASTDANVRADATYLITGGLGALGLRAAQFLVEQGARSIVLVGRRAAGSEAAAAIAGLRAAGARIDVLEADIAKESDASRLAAFLDAGLPPLRGVLHAAGVLDDGVLLQQTAERFERVLAPKVMGAWNLHRMTRTRDLDFFVLFSSVTAWWGTPGQGNYAVANAFMNALSHYRHHLGLPSLSINWGAWGGVGMAAQAVPGHLQARRRANGFGMLDPDRTWFALPPLLRDGRAEAGVAVVNWAEYAAATGDAVPRMFEVVTARGPAGTAAVAPAAARGHAILAELQAAAPRERPALLRKHLAVQAARVLGLSDPGMLDPARPLTDYGMDSMTTIELKNILAKQFDCRLPATLLFDFATLDALCTHLLDEHLKLARDAAIVPPAAPGGAGDSATASLAGLSRDELERLLEREIAAAQGTP